MTKKVPVWLLVIFFLANVCVAQAQEAGKIPRIGYLRAEKPPDNYIEGFRQGLREHGYVEGKNIIVEYRWADGNEDKLHSLVAELISLKLDLLVTSSPAATQAAKGATTTIIRRW